MTTESCLLPPVQRLLAAIDNIKAYNTPGGQPADLDPATAIDRRNLAARLYREHDQAESELRQIVKRIEKNCVPLSRQEEGRGEGEPL